MKNYLQVVKTNTVFRQSHVSLFIYICLLLIYLSVILEHCIFSLQEFAYGYEVSCRFNGVFLWGSFFWISLGWIGAKKGWHGATNHFRYWHVQTTFCHRCVFACQAVCLCSGTQWCCGGAFALSCVSWVSVHLPCLLCLLGLLYCIICFSWSKTWIYLKYKNI